jgi:hypothetical protein
MAHAGDNFIDVTSMCQADGKRWPEFKRSGDTTAYLEELSASLGNPEAGLIMRTRSATGQQGPTFAGRRIVLDCVAWNSKSRSQAGSNRPAESEGQFDTDTSD